MNEQDVARWVEKRYITKAQSQRILADIRDSRKESSSRTLITIISVIGAVLLGLAAITFIASNWQKMGSALKTLVLLASVLAAGAAGYELQYRRKNYPGVGASLIFLSTILFGASVFLVAQIYHVQAHNHLLLLVWLVGVLPLAYVLSSRLIMALSVVIAYAWLAFFIFRGLTFATSSASFYVIVPMFLLFSILLYALGALHYLVPAIAPLARTTRLFGMAVGLLSTFLLTFRLFSGESFISENPGTLVHSLFVTSVVLLVFVGMLLLVLLALNPAKSATNLLECVVMGVLFVLCGLLVFFPPSGDTYTWLFNAALAAMLVTMIWVGSARSDMAVLSMGLRFSIVFIMAKYFDFFWSLLDKALFFFIGGVLLITLAVVIERKLRSLKKEARG